MQNSSVANKKLEAGFDRDMRLIYEEAKTECNYNATRYLQMVNEYGGLQTAKKLLASTEPQYGFAKLWECGRLDLTVEALVTKEKYRSLFTDDEIEEAKRRLRKLEYPI